MSLDPKQELTDLQPTKEFFIGIDSDGCAFDTMEIKHKECFCPNTVMYWDLQQVSKYAREAWDFVNLYSKTRGCNRFHALLDVMKYLSERKEVIERGAKLHDMTAVLEWTKKETKLGNPALEKYAAEVKDPIIDKALAWSKAINADIHEMVHDIPPFPHVRESLVKLRERADALVVSQTPTEALVREWSENDIQQYVHIICGQEYGTKTEHLKYAAKGKYPDNKILMIGDAPGDMKAAKANGVLFYPINPGKEVESWARFYNEALDKFFNLEFEGAYEQALIEEFNTYLPEKPHWNK